MRPNTYTAKTTVSVIAEKPHSCWYTTYSGDGALEAAMNTTKMTLIAAKAVGATDVGRRSRRRTARIDGDGLGHRLLLCNDQCVRRL